MLSYASVLLAKIIARRIPQKIEERLTDDPDLRRIEALAKQSILTLKFIIKKCKKTKF